MNNLIRYPHLVVLVEYTLTCNPSCRFASSTKGKWLILALQTKLDNISSTSDTNLRTARPLPISWLRLPILMLESHASCIHLSQGRHRSSQLPFSSQPLERTTRRKSRHTGKHSSGMTGKPKVINVAHGPSTRNEPGKRHRISCRSQCKQARL